MWGTTNKVDSAEQCCAQCAAYKPQSEDDIYCNGARPRRLALYVCWAPVVSHSCWLGWVEAVSSHTAACFGCMTEHLGGLQAAMCAGYC